MRFIRTLNGRINARFVVSIVRKHDKKGEILVAVTTDGQEMMLEYESMYELDDDVRPVVSAAPGWRVGWADRNSGGSAYYEPIIAWRVGSGYPIPVTASGDEYLDEEFAVVRPDGSVLTYGASFDSIEEWLSAAAEEKAKTKSHLQK